MLRKLHPLEHILLLLVRINHRRSVFKRARSGRKLRRGRCFNFRRRNRPLLKSPNRGHRHSRQRPQPLAQRQPRRLRSLYVQLLLPVRTTQLNSCHVPYTLRLIVRTAGGNPMLSVHSWGKPVSVHRSPSRVRTRGAGNLCSISTGGTGSESRRRGHLGGVGVPPPVRARARIRHPGTRSAHWGLGLNPFIHAG